MTIAQKASTFFRAGTPRVDPEDRHSSSYVYAENAALMFGVAHHSDIIKASVTYPDGSILTYIKTYGPNGVSYALETT